MSVFQISNSPEITISDVNTWVRNGQIWVVWKVGSSEISPKVTRVGYEIYSRDAGLTPSVKQKEWKLEGKVFDEDARGERLKDMDPFVVSSRKLRIPDADPSNPPYVLDSNERVFVLSPHTDMRGTPNASGDYPGHHFIVRPIYRFLDLENGICSLFTSELPFDPSHGSNSTVEYVHNSMGDPVIPHVQKSGFHQIDHIDANGQVTPNGANIPYTIYSLWVDGRQDPDNGRDDIPVLANSSRNGVPHIFIVFSPDEDLTEPGERAIPPYYTGNTIPKTPQDNLSEPSEVHNPDLIPDSNGIVHFLHGGGGNAAKFRPGKGPGIELLPYRCKLVSHDDALFALGQNCRIERNLTTWFGYACNYDAFLRPKDNFSTFVGDKIINYTQRRIVWINDWLMQNNENLDPERAAIMGFSIGSHGASHIGRSYPNKFSTVSLFSHCPISIGDSGFQLATKGIGIPVSPETNLVNPANSPVLSSEVWNYNNPLSIDHDYPIFRQIIGKMDDNNLEGWKRETVVEAAFANSNGWGLQFFWDLRTHVALKPNTYWSKSPYGANNRTVQFDINWQMRYERSKSYPAFYNVNMGQTHPVAPAPPITPNPGNGIDRLDSDPHGSIGGYIAWNRLIETINLWSVDAFLIGSGGSSKGYSPVDQSPYAFASTNLSVRKNSVFTAQSGTPVYFEAFDVTSQQMLVQGNATIDSNSGTIRIDTEKIPLRVNKVVRIQLFK